MKIESITGLFNLELPNNWFFEFEDSIYSIYCNDFQGVIQLCAYFSESANFDIEEILISEKNRFPEMEKSKLNIYDSVLSIQIIDGNLVQYSWITGIKGIRIFATLVTDYDNDSKEQLDIYKRAFDILNTIQLFPNNTANGE
jgi:hypothetical protein